MRYLQQKIKVKKVLDYPRQDGTTKVDIITRDSECYELMCSHLSAHPYIGNEMHRKIDVRLIANEIKNLKSITVHGTILLEALV